MPSGSTWSPPTATRRPTSGPVASRPQTEAAYTSDSQGWSRDNQQAERAVAEHQVVTVDVAGIARKVVALDEVPDAVVDAAQPDRAGEDVAGTGRLVRLISSDHAAAVETLEPLHRDPFDRMLIVQARHEGLRLLTADDQVLAYESPSVDIRS